MEDFTLHIFKPSKTFLKVDFHPILEEYKEDLIPNLRICQIFMSYRKDVSLFHDPTQVEDEK